MILVHLHEQPPIEINREMYIYIHDNLKLLNIAKIVYTNSVTKKVYCVIPFTFFLCITFSPSIFKKITDFSNLVPENFYLRKK